MVHQIILQEDVKGCRETDRGCGEGVAEADSSHHVCKFCGSKESTSSFKQCSNSKAVKYCSRRCQEKHWGQYKTFCQAISSLEEQKRREDRERTGVFVSHLSPQEHARVVRLVGRKCTVKCLLNGLETDALWDTGAQVSIISPNWLKQCLPGCDPRNIEELLRMDGLI